VGELIDTLCNFSCMWIPRTIIFYCTIAKNVCMIVQLIFFWIKCLRFLKSHCICWFKQSHCTRYCAYDIVKSSFWFHICILKKYFIFLWLYYIYNLILYVHNFYCP
jgi:hypothetical protein